MKGLTITDIYDSELESKLKNINNIFHYTARIVIDTMDNIEDAIPIVKMVKQYCDPMIQIQDSAGDKALSDLQLLDKAFKIFNTFKDDCRFWEIGNESNGDWLAPNQYKRIMSVFMEVPVDHVALLTLFYQPGMIEWYAANPIQVSHVGISFYPKDLRELHGTDFSKICEDISKINPNCKILIGEYGFEEWTGTVPPRLKPILRDQIEHQKVFSDKWIGGGFYWDGQKEGF